MERISEFSFRWYDSLQFKISAIFFVLFLVIALSVITVLKTIGDELIEEEAYLRLNEAHQHVIAELEKRSVLSATLADAMANLAENLPSDVDLHQKLFLQLIDYKGTEEFIAGGGIWPGPFQFQEDIERRSFFWGRNPAGQLEYYDDYNRQEGNGYHHEEWYVPATHLAEGEVYWSKSYTDPYSLQPMVTVTAPMIRGGRNIGVSTIDLKLEGLHQQLEKATGLFEGYAFAIDRNGTFLSYPNKDLVISTAKNRDGSELTSFISYQELAKKSPVFVEYAAILDEGRNQLLTTVGTEIQLREELSEKLANGIHHTSQDEANIIAATILSATKGSINNKLEQYDLFLESDPILNEPVFVSVATMPNTYWKIVTVMPYSKGIERIVATYDQLILSTLSAVLLAIFIIWLFIKRIVTAPISHLSKQIKLQVDSDASDIQLIDTTATGELGSLTQIFNQRTEQLLDTQDKIKKMAHFDSLTGLPNRRLLINRLEDKLEFAKRHKYFGALLFIDLDNFKLINDSLGHDIGDELLMRVAERFQKSIRREDTVARLGGDEFVVLFVKDNTYSEHLNREATMVAQKLVHVMEDPFELKGHQHNVDISIGVTIFSHRNSSVDELLRQADTAMYRTKAKGKNGFCFFKPEMQEQADRRLNIEDELRNALDHGQLFLMYQPQVDSHGVCLSAEALIRWSHPSKGMQAPVEFIAIAEECGLVVPLGNWVIDEACRQTKAWNDAGMRLDKIAVNVSPKQFRHTDFVDSVRRSIEKHQINARQLTLEVTEGVVIGDIEDTIQKMHILKSIGVRISVDDFGTGYSSLMYLKKLPLNQLKIDQSFVRDIINDPSDAMIVETIISMSNHLGLDVIAEGVENKGQLDSLIEKGCRQFQGYYFSKPMVAADFSNYMVQQRGPTVSKISSIGPTTIKK